MHRIQFPDGREAIVDRVDADLVAGFSWRVTGAGYVQADRRFLYLYLHRLIAGAGPDERVDHANGDPLDNRRQNLRIATRSENAANRGPDNRRAGKSSRHKGVSWSKSKGRWLAYIHIDGRTRYIGRFSDEDEAARAYNAAALDVWGEFARLNIVPE